MGGRSSTSGMGGLITDQSSNFGQPGTYELYRAGDLSAPNGMVFLSASPEESAIYAFHGIKIKSPDGNGYSRQYLESMEQYHVKVNNPLVVSESTDRDNVIAAWVALHPGQDPKVRTSGLPYKQWERMDKQNAQVLNSGNSPYDAIIYIKPDGHHEVQIPSSRMSSLRQTRSYAYSGQTFREGGGWRTPGVIWRFDKVKGWIRSGTYDPEV